MEKIKPTYSDSTNIYNEVIKQLKNGSKERNEIVTDLERKLGHNANAIRNSIRDLIDQGYVQIQEMIGSGAIIALNPEFKGNTVSLTDGELPPMK